MWRSNLPTDVSIFVLRHGESENNVLGLDCADLSNKALYGLTALGVDQIERVASEPRGFDVILHSPLRRAVESAVILSQTWGTALTREDLLIEVSVGVFENRPEAERRDWKMKNGTRDYPSGESRSDVDQRVTAVLDRICTSYRGQSVLLVTHGTFLLHLLTAVFDEIDWQAYCDIYSNGRRLFELRTYGAVLATAE